MSYLYNSRRVRSDPEQRQTEGKSPSIDANIVGYQLPNAGTKVSQIASGVKGNGHVFGGCSRGESTTYTSSMPLLVRSPPALTNISFF